jgi:hypothetical protein
MCARFWCEGIHITNLKWIDHLKALHGCPSGPGATLAQKDDEGVNMLFVKA